MDSPAALLAAVLLEVAFPAAAALTLARLALKGLAVARAGAARLAGALPARPHPGTQARAA